MIHYFSFITHTKSSKIVLSGREDYCDYSNDDDTPVIIIDSNLKQSMEKYPIRPAHDHVFLIEQWNENVLMEKLKDLVLKP